MTHVTPLLALALGLLFLAFTACTTDYTAKAVSEGAIICHIPGTPSYRVTTNSEATCKMIGGKL